TMHASFDQEFQQLLQALPVDRIIGFERRNERRIYSVELHVCFTPLCVFSVHSTQILRTSPAWPEAVEPCPVNDRQVMSNSSGQVTTEQPWQPSVPPHRVPIRQLNPGSPGQDSATS